MAQDYVNGIQAEFKQIEGAILMAQASICRLEQFRPLLSQASDPAKTEKQFDTLVARIDSAMRAKKAIHATLKAEQGIPRPRVGT